MKRRDLHLDIVRGLAIFSVVLGHLDTGLKGQIIYVFHMPFFFMISGYFHRVEPDEKAYFWRKFLSLIVPYLAYLFILRAGAIVDITASIVADPSFGGVADLGVYVAKLLYGGDRLRGDIGMHWFVSCLFLTQQLFNFVSLRIKSRRTILGIAAGMYVLAFVDQLIPGYISFPWVANVVLCSFPIYVVGAFYGRSLLKGFSWKWVAVATGIAVFASVLMAAGYVLSFRMKLAYYGFFVLSPLAAFAFTKLLSVFSASLVRSKQITWLLAGVGQASITVMFFHRVVQYNLPEFLQLELLWLQAIVITAICCVVHLLLQQVGLLKILFLGSYRDAERWIRSVKKERAVLASKGEKTALVPKRQETVLASEVVDRHR